MPDLLIELLSEEIPARMQAQAAEDFRRIVARRLEEAGLSFNEAVSFVTPRRLTLLVRDLPLRQPDRTEERKGPRVGAPDKAIEGFLRSAGLKSLDECEQRTVGNATFWFLVRERKGGEARKVLPGLVAESILEMPWPKSMRWADTTARYVRPLHNVLAIFDGKPLEGAFQVGGSIGGLRFNAETRGHRFLAPEPFSVSGWDEYRAGLRARHVMLDPAERKETIGSEVTRLATAEGLTLKEDRGLLTEVVGLVEWPVVLVGSIDDAFMEVPPEVLTTAMRTHQKYFSLLREDGSLAPRFATVANMVAADGGRQILAGNERVLRARLSDARFFWDQDRETPLEASLPALDEVVFHARLGSVGDRARRLERLAEAIAGYVPGADPAAAREAARLCKADLVSGMVGEFPELQGIMGRYYALEQKLDPAVADAIADHYSPQGPGDRCPTMPVSVAVALADKADILTGFFAIDERPTGSRDPYALRRAALGMIRLILENRLRVPLRAVFGAAYEIYRETLPTFAAASPEGLPPEAVVTQLLDFFADRLKVHLREEGVRHDMIAAVFALGDEDDLVRLLARVHALEAFVASEDGANLLTAYRRARNIVAIEEKKDAARYEGADVDAGAFAAPEEQRLLRELETAREVSAAAREAEDFSAAMGALAALRTSVDAFFDEVTVNTEDSDLRANRLRLLSAIRSTMEESADFSKIEG